MDRRPPLNMSSYPRNVNKNIWFYTTPQAFPNQSYQFMQFTETVFTHRLLTPRPVSYAHGAVPDVRSFIQLFPPTN